MIAVSSGFLFVPMVAFALDGGPCGVGIGKLSDDDAGMLLRSGCGAGEPSVVIVELF